jgi:hypothetical protein
MSSASEVKAGQVAYFAIWVWSTKAPSYGIRVDTSVASAQYVEAPRFTVCPVADKTTCKLGNLPVGQADELEAGVRVLSKAALGEQVQLTAKAEAKGSQSNDGSATDLVVVSPKPSPTTTTTSPVASLPPPQSLPPIAGTGTSPGNASGLFPTVGPTSSPGASSVGPSRSVNLPARVSDASATVPLDPRLIGGQLVGLAVLAGAVAIAIARLSLRQRAPQDDSSKPSQ